MVDTVVDAFILCNEREERVFAIVEDLHSHGITTYFWRRDVNHGEEWEPLDGERKGNCMTRLKSQATLASSTFPFAPMLVSHWKIRAGRQGRPAPGFFLEADRSNPNSFQSKK